MSTHYRTCIQYISNKCTALQQVVQNNEKKIYTKKNLLRGFICILKNIGLPQSMCVKTVNMSKPLDCYNLIELQFTCLTSTFFDWTHRINLFIQFSLVQFVTHSMHSGGKGMFYLVPCLHYLAMSTKTTTSIRQQS